LGRPTGNWSGAECGNLMAALPFQPFDILVTDVITGGQNYANDVLHVYLSDVAPDVVNDTLKADIAEIAVGNGYAGSVDINIGFSSVRKIFTFFGDSFLLTAAGGDIAQWQWIILFNEDTTVKVDPLIGFWDHGQKANITNGNTHEILFNGSPVGTPGSFLTMLSFV